MEPNSGTDNNDLNASNDSVPVTITPTVPPADQFGAPSDAAPAEASTPSVEPAAVEAAPVDVASATPTTEPAPIDPLHPANIAAAAPVVLPSEQVAPTVAEGTAMPVGVPASKMAGGGKRSLKALLVAILVVVILGGGSAAAYFGVVAPNRPANVLKSAVAHSLQSTGGSFTGTLNLGPATGTGLAAKAAISGSENAKAKSADFVLNLDVSGVSFPLEARYVDSNLYVKVGDLSQISSLLQSLDPGTGAIVQQLSGAVSNKWFELDSTVINEAGGSCFTGINWTLNNADVKLLENAYGKHPFTTITSSSSDTVQGQKVEKLVLSIDDDKAAAYLKNLNVNSLSLVQQLKKCEKNPTSTTSSYSSLADHDKTPITVWINKSTHQIVQFSTQTTAQDAKKSNEKGSLVLDLKYTVPTITAPVGAESITQLITDVTNAIGLPGVDPTTILDNLLGGASGSQTQANDALRQTDIASLQTNLEAYAANHNGHYPSLKDMNSASWRAANMSGLDPTALKDPSGSSETLAAKPAKNVYAYQPTTASGGSCESNDSLCAKYTLTATLSDGSVDAVQSLE